ERITRALAICEGRRSREAHNGASRALGGGCFIPESLVLGAGEVLELVDSDVALPPADLRDVRAADDDCVSGRVVGVIVEHTAADVSAVDVELLERLAAAEVVASSDVVCVLREQLRADVGVELEEND